MYFPTVDLTSQIVEDATSQQLRHRLVGNATILELFGDIVPSRSDALADESHALLTLKGYKGTTPNQDRSVIVKFFLENNATSSLVEEEYYSTSDDTSGVGREALLMGIFDGHGDRGHEVSQHVALELPKVFSRIMKQTSGNPASISPTDPKYSDLIQQVMKETFLEIDNTEPVKGSGASGGSTVSTLFYPGYGSRLYLANVGDSITSIVLFSKSSQQSTIVKQNRKDKPDLDDERKRIEAAGGQVYVPFVRPSVNGYGPKESSRLLITSPGGFQIGLAMSRSIGDAEGKPFGLIAEPTVEMFDVKEYYLQMEFTPEQIADSEWFAVIASDGVYDVLPPETVIQRLGASLFGNDERASVGNECERLIREAGRLWIMSFVDQPYRDDITLGISKIKLQY
jgi:serine/threonine protein phosphatase PrpC